MHLDILNVELNWYRRHFVLLPGTDIGI